MGLMLLAGPAAAAELESDESGYTFVSVPDFLNVDVADISGLPSYDGGANSTSPDMRTAIDTVLDSVASEDPAFVTVAGDMVMGHWDRDVDNRQIFGPTGTRAEKAAAIDAAADTYYSAWKQRFADRGLTVHAGIGDHELGDNNWAAGSDKAHLVSTYKDQYAEHFTKDSSGNYRYDQRPVGTPYEGTAYAFQHENTLIANVDVFYQQDPDVSIHGKTGSVRPDVVGEQLTWLDNVLTDARNDPTVDHVFVQGHTPALTPVREQRNHIFIEDGENTEFWETLEKHDVDAYLAGEAHEMTASNHGGVEQIVHGMLLGYENTSDVNYVVGHVQDDVINFEVKRMDTDPSGGDMWQTGSNRPRQQIALDSDGFQTVGTLTMDKSSGETVYKNRTGMFEWFGTTPESAPGEIPEPDTYLAIDNAGFQKVFTDGTLPTPVAMPDADFTENFGDTQLKKAGTAVYVPAWRPAPGDDGASAQSGVFNNVAAVNDLFDDPDNDVGVVFGDAVKNELDASLTEGTYVLSVLVGDRSDTGFAGGDLFLQAGDITLDPALIRKPTPEEGGHTTWTSVFEIAADDPNLGETLTIGFAPGGGGQTLLDDFKLGYTVPEPASLALLGLGGLMVLPRRRR